MTHPHTVSPLCVPFVIKLHTLASANGKHLKLMFIAMSEWKFVTSTTTMTTLHFQYCWMTFNAADQKNTSLTVHATSGAFTTVDIAKMSPFRVTVRFHVLSKM